MRFVLLGREIEIQRKHLFAYLTAFVLYIVIFLSLVALYLGISGMSALDYFFTNPMPYLVQGGDLIGIVSSLLLAFLMVKVSIRFLGRKPDIGDCRALATLPFLFFSIVPVQLFLLLLIASAIMQSWPTLSWLGYALVSVINIVALAGISSYLIYLWMLIISRPETDRMKNIIQCTVIFTVLVLLITEFLTYVIGYQGAIPYPMTYTPLALAMKISSYFLLGFVVLYHIKNQKLDASAILFAGLFLASGILGIISSLIFYSNLGISPTTALIRNATALALLYFRSGAKLELKKR